MVGYYFIIYNVMRRSQGNIEGEIIVKYHNNWSKILRFTIG